MKIVNSLRLTSEMILFQLPYDKTEALSMSKKKKSIVNEGKMRIMADLNNLEPGESVNEHREFETANILLAGEEIKQQNNNL